MRRLSIYLEELREQLEWSEENSGQTSTANRARLREHTGEEKADDVVTLNVTGKAAGLAPSGKGEVEFMPPSVEVRRA